MKTKINLIILFVFTVIVSFSAEKVLPFQTTLSQNSVENDRYEGKLISSVEFEGNKIFSSKELLAVFDFDDDIAGKVNELFVFPYRKNNTETTIKYKLRDFLVSHGYNRAEIGKLKFAEDGNFIKLIIPIKEGILYRIGKINITGVKEFTVEEVENFLGFKQGQSYNVNALHIKAFKELPKFYGNRGFASCNVDIENPRERNEAKNSNERILDFDIIVNEGKRFRVNQINIIGNADEGLVRSFFAIKEGEIFNQFKIDTGLEKLKESDLFEEINFDSDVEIRINEEEENMGNDFKYVKSESGVDYKVRLKNHTQTENKKTDTVSINIRINKRKPSKNHYIGSVNFVGNKTISDTELNKFFNLQKNSYFDVENFIEKIRIFNQIGKFKPIVENDINIEVGSEGKADDEFSEQINLTINITELNQNSKLKSFD